MDLRGGYLRVCHGIHLASVRDRPEGCHLTVARKVAIVAKAATAAFAPYQDPNWEIWGMPWVRYQRAPDLYFDLHSEECWARNEMPMEEREEWEARAAASDVPIYCHPSRLHLFKSAIAFPYESIDRLTSIPFFENTIAYQLAFALWSHRQARIS